MPTRNRRLCEPLLKTRYINLRFDRLSGLIDRFCFWVTLKRLGLDRQTNKKFSVQLRWQGRVKTSDYRWNSVADELFGCTERRIMRFSIAELPNESDSDRHAVVSISMSALCVPSATLIHVAILINQKVVANIRPAWSKQLYNRQIWIAYITILYCLVVH